jgi:hypothetical protein
MLHRCYEMLPPEDAPGLLKMAQEAEAREKLTKEKLAAGVSLTDLTGTKRLIEADVPGIVRKIRSQA